MTEDPRPDAVDPDESTVEQAEGTVEGDGSAVDVDAEPAEDQLGVSDEDTVDGDESAGDVDAEPAEDDPAEDDPAEDDPAEDDPAEDDSAEDDPADDDEWIDEDDSAEDDPAEDDPAEDDPAEDDPADDDEWIDEDDSAEDDPAEDDSAEDDPADDDEWIDEDDEQVIFSTNDPAARQAGFAEAKIALGRSSLIVMPTDTVYGLVADAFDPTAVRRLFRAKGRSRRMPIPVLIGSVDTLRALATNVTPDTRELARRFWPGGLTLICRQQPSLSWDLGDSRGTVALRMPDHRDALDLLQDHGPLAVTSANLTGEPPATTVQQAYDSLGESVDVYLDSGPTPGSVPSTIVDATGDELVVVRQGVITLEQLREVIPDVVAETERD